MKLGIVVTIGLNPLPVLVAVRRLREKFPQAAFVFVASQTDELDRILHALRSTKTPELSWHFIQLTNSKASHDIDTKIKNWIISNGFDHVHFHYTGGTKVMVLHVIRALDALRFPVTTSYMGAEEHFLLGSIPGQSGESNFGAPDERNDCALSFEQLANLHGHTTHYRLKTRNWEYTAGRGHRNGRPNPHIPNLPTCPSGSWVSSADPVANIHLAPRLFDDWKANIIDPFRDTWFPERHGPWPDLPDPNRAPATPISWPFQKGSASTIPDRMNVALGTQAWDGTTFRPGNLTPQQLEKVGSWLLGGWLETYVFSKFTEVLGLNVVPIATSARFARLEFDDEAKTRQKVVKKDFEIDVAVLLGYQLVVVSCYTGKDSQRGKQKGFEAIHRARQIGGSEALAVLVCLAHGEEGEEIEAELDAQSRTFGVPIRVWHRHHLQTLSQRVSDLLREISFTCI